MTEKHRDPYEQLENIAKNAHLSDEDKKVIRETNKALRHLAKLSLVSLSLVSCFKDMLFDDPPVALQELHDAAIIISDNDAE